MSEEATEVIEDESLGSIFDGEKDEIAEAEETEVIEDEPTGEIEDEAQAEATQEETTPPVEEDSEKVLKAQIAKAKDEKQKRQKLKRENEALRQQVAAQPKPEAPDPFAEPDKAIEHAKTELRQEFQQQFLNMSEQGAKARHSDDFDDLSNMFFDELLVDNPALQAEAMSKTDPYEFIYQTAKNHRDMSELTQAGGVDAFKANLEKEIRAKIELETKASRNKDVEDKITASIPGSLSNKRASGGNKSVLQTEDKPLDKLF